MMTHVMPRDTATLSNPHSWRFFRAGGFDQVRLDRGADLAALGQLDQKLWVALACPTAGLEFDSKTLALIDIDQDGRIRALELLAALEWTLINLKSPESLLAAPDALPLASINDSHPEGKRILASARHFLDTLGRSNQAAISIVDITDISKSFAQTQFNGDGIIPAESTDDPGLRTLIGEIIHCVGALNDRGSKPGINQAAVDRFFSDAKAFCLWQQQASSPLITLLGSDTAAAWAAMTPVKAKIDDYFARCRLAAFDGRATGPLNRAEAEYATIAAKDLSANVAEACGWPLARIQPGKPLSLREGLNPAWAGPVALLTSLAVKPILGNDDSLTEAQWTDLLNRFQPYQSWLATKPAGSVEKLGISRLQQIIAGNGHSALTSLIAQDQALETEYQAMESVDKLVRFHRDLFPLLNNFVSFSYFYGRRDKAVFQCGTLYLDQRACDLCIRVSDAAKHAAMAGFSGAYLAYCDCVRKATGEKMTIAAAFTDGDADNLMAGRNGVFYDRQGRDWDATIVRIVDNPISIRQAFWAPYKKLARFVEEQITKRAASADAAASDKLSAAATTAGKAAETGKTPEAKPKFDSGVVAALGVAAAGLGGMIGGIVSSFLDLGPLMPLGLFGLVLLISGPSMLLAALKLRKRNLGPLLDANGWAINAKASINIPFGSSLTSIATLPPGAESSLDDPFAEKRNPWAFPLLLLCLIAATAMVYFVYVLFYVSVAPR